MIKVYKPNIYNTYYEFKPDACDQKRQYRRAIR